MLLDYSFRVENNSFVSKLDAYFSKLMSSQMFLNRVQLCLKASRFSLCLWLTGIYTESFYSILECVVVYCE